jgi:glycosyltransferase involved in cell wall biosynthesis
VTATANRRPRLLVLSSLFPSAVQPAAGVFIRERMFRVGSQLPIVVVAPQAWFPLQGLIRRFRPHFRPTAPRYEVMQGVEVYRPPFLSFPGVLKRFDGLFMALSVRGLVRRLVREKGIDVLDVHFGYPDGRAGTLLGRWLRLPVVLTLRGKEERQARTSVGAPLRRAVLAADRIVTVSDALRDVALGFGASPSRVSTIGNGVDLSRFSPLPKAQARAELKLPADARIVVSVGTLVERKGFHRVIEVLPALRRTLPDLHFLIVGGAGPEGDDSARLRAQVQQLGLGEHVHFLGPTSPDRLRVPLSAADVFVLASSYEGWANVLLEAMACELPVVATDVGGNAQVVRETTLGRIVPFGDAAALERALREALGHDWDRAAIRAYAESNSWDVRIPAVIRVLESVCDTDAGAEAGTAAVKASRVSHAG